MRLLFVKETMAWPRSSGHDVHSYHMMRALTELGHEVSLITRAEPSPEAIAGLPLTFRRTFPPGHDGPLDGHGLRLSRMQERFRSYWGIAPRAIRAVGQLAEACHADAVVVVGLNVLPYLGGVKGRCRVWYAADEWVWHHLSQVRPAVRATWSNLRDALIKGWYERAYGPLLNRIWVVTDSDRRAMRWATGQQTVDVIPNGVDAEYYAPVQQDQAAGSCTFWGRLDFGPNIQALDWFVSSVWPLVRRKVPDARFTIYGFNPTAAVARFSGREGITLVSDLPDLRPEVARHQVVVLPFVSGGGIKNKLLEAASMGKAILCSPQACGGLRRSHQPPLLLARDAGHWVSGLLALWSNPAWRQRLGQEARRWVLTHHGWLAAARTALAGLEQSVREKHP